jgi:hypothetical protein
MSSAAELFEPGEYLDTRRPGYFSICGRPEGIWRQTSYELSNLPAVVNGVNPFIDTWITQAVFNGPNRRAVNLRDVGLLFADLDTYHRPDLARMIPEAQASRLCAFCSAEGIPEPSIVLYSGRGLQAKWLLTSALGPAALMEWEAAERALVRLLESFAADQAAKDVSRVLRLDRTTNTKSGERVRVVHVTGGTENCPARYDFTELWALLGAQEIQSSPREERRKAADRASSALSSRLILSLPQETALRRLNWCRLYDLRDLCAMRGGAREGWRELALFWCLNFLLRAAPGKACDLWKEAETLAAQIAPGERFYRDSDLSTLYRKAQSVSNGEGVTYNGRTYPALYTPRNQTLLDVFRITPAEERGLRTIISQAEQVRRQREKRRAAGIRPRQEYEADSLSRLRPWEELGMSRAWWYRTVRKAGE